MAGQAVGERDARANEPSRDVDHDDWSDFDALLLGGAQDELRGRQASGVGDDAGDEDESLQEPDAGDYEDEDEDEAGAEDSNADDEADGDEGDEPSEPGGPEAERLGQWADTVRSTPQRLSEVPARHRAAVLQEALSRQMEAGKESMKAAALEAIRVAQQRAYQKGQDEARAAFQSDADFAEIRELYENDRDAFLDMMDEKPDRAAAFLQRIQAERNPQAADGASALRAQAEALGAQLEGKPVAQAYLRKVMQEHGAERWAATPEGLRQLTADVAEALAEERLAAKRAEEEPQRKAAAKRQENAAKRQGLPRPGRDQARGGAKAAPESDGANWMEDLRVGFAEARNKRKN